MGPLLWNVMYNDVIKLKVPDEATVIGSADDIAIVVTAANEVELMATRAIVENGWKQ